VIAINNDPAAPIFEYADYCIIGDVHEIVPALVKTLEEKSSVTQSG
jgi:electron transfer flavoprotein alpha subunit